MKVLIAAGGTAGHINPAISIAQGIKERFPLADIQFVGRKKGMEFCIVKGAGYKFHTLEVRGFQRKINLQNIVKNIKAMWFLAFAFPNANKILKTFIPDLVIGTGGYVSGPIVLAAAKKGIKTAIHEQNAYPGITNKILAKSVDLVMVPSQSAVNRMGYPDKTVITGNPVSLKLQGQDRDAARSKLLAGNRIVIVSYGGSLGAMRLNEAVAKFAAWHIKNRDFLHVHATGNIEKDSFSRLAKELRLDESPNFIVKEFIHNMPELLTAADLVICRAGAITLAELATVGKAAVLIPSPNVAENHQYYNALEFEKAGAAMLIEEEKLNDNSLINAVSKMVDTKGMLCEMGNRAKTLAHAGTMNKIINLLETLANNKCFMPKS